MLTPDEYESSISEGISSTAEENKFALVVGVNKSAVSSSLPPLEYAEVDAQDIYGILRLTACKFHFPTPVLLGHEAKTENVRSAVIKLVQEKTDQDFLLFYFIGHAQPVKMRDGRSDIYFVTHDFDPNAVRIDAGSHLSMSWLREILYHFSDAGKVLIILDCCYAGNMIEARPHPDRIHIEVDIRKIVEECLGSPGINYQNGRLRVILTATGYNTPAQERAMTNLILSALQGKAPKSMDDEGNVNIHFLYTYLQSQMTQEQLPNLSGEFPRTCILASYPENSRAYLQQLQEASENERWNKVSQLIDKVSTVSDVITDPNYFEKRATTSHTQPFDHVTCNNSSIADLDLVLITEFLKKDRVLLQEDFHSGASLQDQLLRFGLLQGPFPTYGALLCFGKEPPRWVSGASTRCIDWQSDDRLLGWQDDREYRGNLVSQFEKSLDFLRKSLHLKRVINKEEITEEWELPFLALREALVNALVHREYTNRTESVYVEVFNDRVEISSPGELPPLMKLELLGTENKCHPRNPQIARIFYLFGHVEKVGSGIQRMQQAMKNANHPPPKFELTGTKTLTVTLYRSKEFYQLPLFNTKEDPTIDGLDKYVDILVKGLKGDLNTLAGLRTSRGMTYKGVMEALKVFLPKDFKKPDDFLVRAVELVLDEVFGKDGWSQEPRESKSKRNKPTWWVTVKK